MHECLEWARGPLFRFAILFMALGMVRLVVLSILNLRAAIKRAGNKETSLGPVLASTLRWLVPHGGAVGRHPVLTTASVMFHVAMIIIPIFLGAHVLLWERGLGVSWPVLGQTWADVLTLVGAAAGAVLISQRLFVRAARELSRPQDYLLPSLIITTFVAGFLAMHPAINPFAYDSTLFVHVISGNLILVALPFSKLSHALLFPITRLVSEMGWHLAPDAGQRVAVTLNKENERV